MGVKWLSVVMAKVDCGKRQRALVEGKRREEEEGRKSGGEGGGGGEWQRAEPLSGGVASRRGVGSGSLNIYASEREQGTPALLGPLRSVSACHIEINFPSTVSRRCFSATCRFSGKPSELPLHFPRRRIFVRLNQISFPPANPRPCPAPTQSTRSPTCHGDTDLANVDTLN